jgi:hypothetical protein
MPGMRESVKLLCRLCCCIVDAVDLNILASSSRSLNTQLLLANMHSSQLLPAACALLPQHPRKEGILLLPLTLPLLPVTIAWSSSHQQHPRK